jgi:uncharacterized circularly permuted ATP-grasp superfamily protein/uncharacterized alpha-E superfamily protein
MSIVDTLAPLLSADYRPIDGVYDEMSFAAGGLRPNWDHFISEISALGADAMGRRWKTARQRIRENGVTYNIYGDPQGMHRPWSLDAIPLLIPPDEWKTLEAGLIQRAHLLNSILGDLYGPQRLLREGHLPPSAIFANPGFWRPCHGVKVRNGTYLHLLAVDLARSPNGDWWVLSDRTQTPSGAGYALENRIVLSETFPDLFREFNVERLAAFFRNFRDNLISLAPSGSANPRVVLLTPGPLNETYFEHSYLARYLNFSLAEGPDLTVRDSKVFLKTLEGLKPVDVILRRVDDDFCDPIELRGDSFLGVAGLVEAVRAGNVAVANALGSGVIETPALMPFLPGLARHLLGEPLKLPSVATWWCGQVKPREYVRENIDRLVIKPAMRNNTMEPVFGGKLTDEKKARLLENINARPWEYAGQELLHLSTGPVWSGESLTPRRVALRVYLAAVGDTWVAMPGGLARVSQTVDTPVVSMQQGGGSKDVWVLSESPIEDHVSMLHAADAPVPLNRGANSDLPSRAADFLYWLGRYAERCEHLARVLRVILTHLTGEAATPGTPEWDSLIRLHRLIVPDTDQLIGEEPGEDLQGHLDLAGDLEQEVLSLIFAEERSDSLQRNFARASRMAMQVRDRVSNDLIRIVNQFNTLTKPDSGTAWGYVSAGDALAVLNRCIATLSSLRGTEMENITRGPGWHFLNLGHRMERSVQLVRLFRELIVPRSAATQPGLEMLLEVADSSMTYRTRYFTAIQAAPVLDLLMNDELNPRSLAFQMRDLYEHSNYLAKFISKGGSEWPAARQQKVEEAGASLFDADLYYLCNDRRTLEDRLLSLEFALPAFSDAITNVCFSHAEVERVA